MKSNFNLHAYTMIEGVDDIEEFVLMQKCKHHIRGVVFASVTDIWTEEFYPKEWNLIQARVE